MANNIQYLEKKKDETTTKEENTSDPFAEYGETVEIDDGFLD